MSESPLVRCIREFAEIPFVRGSIFVMLGAHAGVLIFCLGAWLGGFLADALPWPVRLFTNS